MQLRRFVLDAGMPAAQGAGRADDHHQAGVPAPSAPSTSAHVHAVFDTFGQAVLAVASTAPWLVALFALVLGTAIVRALRSVLHGGHAEDPVRRFSNADRKVIFDRAGNQCEHFFPVSGRCRNTDGLQADHIHPHSRGGATSLTNGQALCGRHNLEKSARIPWEWQLKRFAKRRASYFVEGHNPAVVRHQVGTQPRSAKRKNFSVA